MQYKVPQNIDLQDKIIGPLTLIQFLYLMAGGMIIYISYEAIKNTFVFAVIAIPVGLLSFGLAFLKIQDQPFPKFLTALLFYLVLPKTRVWHKESSQEKFPSEMVSVEKKPVKKEEKEIKHVEKSELEKLASILDTQDPHKKTSQKNNKKAKEPEVTDIFA